jgi:hypothetical protein
MAQFRYFAYGSNMLIEWLGGRCPSATAQQVGWVDDWALTFSKMSTDGSGKATIFPKAGSRVFGVVFEIDLAERQALDAAEKGYSRRDHFPLQVANTSSPLFATTYLAENTQIDLNLKPYDWYLGLVIAGARQQQLPLEYISTLEAEPSRMDGRTDRKIRLEAIKVLRDIRL